MAELIASASIEVTPRDAGICARWAICCLRGRWSTSPRCREPIPTTSPRPPTAVRAAGHVPVPHIAARGYTDLDHVDSVVGALVTEAQVDDVLVVAEG